jgi:hypothetical protein
MNPADMSPAAQPAATGKATLSAARTAIGHRGADGLSLNSAPIRNAGRGGGGGCPEYGFMGSRSAGIHGSLILAAQHICVPSELENQSNLKAKAL